MYPISNNTLYNVDIGYKPIFYFWEKYITSGACGESYHVHVHLSIIFGSQRTVHVVCAKVLFIIKNIFRKTTTNDFTIFILGVRVDITCNNAFET